MVLFLTEGGWLALPCRQPCFCLGDVGERLVPAPFECAGSQAVGRCHAGILPLRPLGRVARFRYRQYQRLAGETVGGAHPLEGRHGRSDASGREGVQDGSVDGPIDTEAANRQTEGRATIDAPPMAEIPWHSARRTAIGHSELPSTAATA